MTYGSSCESLHRPHILQWKARSIRDSSVACANDPACGERFRTSNCAARGVKLSSRFLIGPIRFFRQWFVPSISRCAEKYVIRTAMLTLGAGKCGIALIPPPEGDSVRRKSSCKQHLSLRLASAQNLYAGIA